jgi:hypothetical protein
MASAFHPQKLLEIPSQPGQQISSLLVEAQGNLIVAAIVSLPTMSGDDVASSFGLVKKIDLKATKSSLAFCQDWTPRHFIH